MDFTVAANVGGVSGEEKSTKVSGTRVVGGAGAIAGSTLPFTGFSIFWVSLVAAGLLLLGLLLLTLGKRGEQA